MPEKPLVNHSQFSGVGVAGRGLAAVDRLALGLGPWESAKTCECGPISRSNHQRTVENGSKEWVRPHLLDRAAFLFSSEQLRQNVVDNAHVEVFFLSDFFQSL